MLGEFVVAVIGIMDVHPAGASLDSSLIKGSYFSASFVLTVANFGSRNLIKDWLLDYKSFKFHCVLDHFHCVLKDGCCKVYRVAASMRKGR